MRLSEREAVEFPGIVVMLSPFEELRHQKQMAGGWCVEPRVSSDATARRTRTRPEDTGAGSYTKCGADCTEIPSRVVMGLHDASNGACGELCLCERALFFAQNCSTQIVLGSDRQRKS